MNRSCGCTDDSGCANSYNCSNMCDGDYSNWCDRDNRFPVGMGYVPWQKFEDLYCAEEGFCTGTIFKQLDLEFCGRSCR